jgi:hypothetical protein
VKLKIVMRPIPAILSAILLASCPLAASTSSHAMMCVADPLEEQIANADAIIAGTVIAVRYVPNSWSDWMCWKNEPGGHEHCGAKVATVRVDGTWKGELPLQVDVYSEDGCYCTGEYFFANEEMFLVLTQYRGVTSPTVNVDYRTYSCGKSMPLDDAEKNGVVDFVNKRMPMR